MRRMRAISTCSQSVAHPTRAVAALRARQWLALSAVISRSEGCRSYTTHTPSFPANSSSSSSSMVARRRGAHHLEHENDDEKGSLHRNRVLPHNLPKPDYEAGKGAAWGEKAMLKRYVNEELLTDLVTSLGSKNKIERMRLLMRYDARPWNVFVRLDHASLSLKDPECARLLLWTAAIVQLETHHGRKVHALQMGQEMMEIMQRKHRIGTETRMAFYRLCEVSRDLTTAFEYFTAYVKKNYPPKMSPEHQVSVSSSLASGGAADEGVFQRRYTADVLIHFVWLLRIAAAQPIDSKCEEIAQIIRNLYESNDLGAYGALASEPTNEGHREKLILEAAAAANLMKTGADGGVRGENETTFSAAGHDGQSRHPDEASSLQEASNGDVSTVVLSTQTPSAYLGGASASTHMQHMEIFSLLLLLRPRIELVVRLEAEADATILGWIDECCEALRTTRNHHTPNSGDTNRGTRSCASQQTFSVQSGRWFINPNCPAQQRLPQHSMMFPHLDGGVYVAGNILSPTAESSGVFAMPSLSGCEDGGSAIVPTLSAYSTSTYSSSDKSRLGGATPCYFVLSPPTWDRPYLRDSLLRDDIIEQLEGLAFSFFRTSASSSDSSGNRPLTVTNPVLKQLLAQESPQKRFALLTELVTRVKKEIAALGENYMDWVEKKTGVRPASASFAFTSDGELVDEAANVKATKGPGTDPSSAVFSLVKKRIREEAEERARKGGGSLQLDRGQHRAKGQHIAAILKAPIPPAMRENSVWRLPMAPTRQGLPTLFLAKMEEAAADLPLHDNAMCTSRRTPIVVDASRLIQVPSPTDATNGDGSSSSSASSEAATLKLNVANNSHLSLFANSVNAHGQMTAEMYHYLLVALSQYSASTAISLLDKIASAGMQLIDVTRASVLCGLLTEGIHSENVEREKERKKLQEDAAVRMRESAPTGSNKGVENSGEHDSIPNSGNGDRDLNEDLVLPTDFAHASISERLYSLLCREEKAPLTISVNLFRDQLEAMTIRADFDRDNDVTRATQAYWSFDYPLLLEYRNAFATREAFYSFLLPSTGVNALLDLVLASETHKKVFRDSVFDGERRSNSKSSSSGSEEDSSPFLPEQSLRELRNSLPIIDADLGRAISNYIVSLASGKAPIVDGDVVRGGHGYTNTNGCYSNNYSGESVRSHYEEGNAIDSVMDLITTQLPKLDIGLIGRVPFFETYALATEGRRSSSSSAERGRMTNQEAREIQIKSPRGHRAGGDEESEEKSEIATSLSELRDRINQRSTRRLSSNQNGKTVVQPLYLLDASFIENKEHVSTLLRIISSHRKSSGDKKFTQNSAMSESESEVAPPLLLIPYSTLSDLARTASGVGRDIFLDASMILDGTLSPEELEKKMLGGGGRAEADRTSTSTDSNVNGGGFGADDSSTLSSSRNALANLGTAAISKFDAPTTEMQIALEALAGVARLIAKVPKSMMVLHFTEMCLAYTTLEGPLVVGNMKVINKNNEFASLSCENSDTWLLRMAALLVSLSGTTTTAVTASSTATKAKVEYAVHLCTDDPAFVLRVRNEPTLRGLSHKVNFLSTSPLVSGLLKIENDPLSPLAYPSNPEAHGAEGEAVARKIESSSTNNHVDGAAKPDTSDEDLLVVTESKPIFNTATSHSLASDQQLSSERSLLLADKKEDAATEKHKYSSLWGQDREAILASIAPLVEVDATTKQGPAERHDSESNGSGRTYKRADVTNVNDEAASDDWLANLENERPINPITPELLAAEEEEARRSREARGGPDDEEREEVNIAKNGPATDVGEFTVDSWMDLLGEGEDEVVLPVVRADVSNFQSESNQGNDEQSSASESNEEGDEQFALDTDEVEDFDITMGLENWGRGAGGDDTTTSEDLKTKSEVMMAALQRKKDVALIPSLASYPHTKNTVKSSGLPSIAPQDARPKWVKIIGDVSAERKNADDLLQELIASPDKEAAELAVRFLKRQEEENKIRKEMTVNDSLSSQIHDIQGQDQGAIFYGQFDSTRTASPMEMLTIEQHNYMRLQKAMQTGGALAVKKLLRVIEQEGLTGLDAKGGSRGGASKYDLTQIVNKDTRVTKGKGSDVAMTEDDEAKIEREDERKMRTHSEKWSNRGLVQDHFAHQTVSKSKRAVGRSGLNRHLHSSINTEEFYVYEANINDPRNARLVEEYKRQQEYRTNKKASFLLSPEKRERDAKKVSGAFEEPLAKKGTHSRKGSSSRNSR